VNLMAGKIQRPRIQCRRNIISWWDIVAIYSGYYHIVGLKTDGTVVAVGNNSNGHCNTKDIVI